MGYGAKVTTIGGYDPQHSKAFLKSALQCRSGSPPDPCEVPKFHSTIL